MKHSIFSKEIPLAILWAFLDTVCKYLDTYFMIDKTTFIKMRYDSKQVAFIESLKPYYYKSKHSYLETTHYNGFVTILRQICNLHNHPYTTVKKFDHCDYTICYFIERPTKERPNDNRDFLI